MLFGDTGSLNSGQYYHLSLLYTVEPRFNDLRYNDILGITINNLLPTQPKL